MLRLFLILLGFAVLPLTAVELTGTVRDEHRQPLPDIPVTNGREVVRSGQRGEFSLPLHPATRFVSLIEPANFRAPRWYLAVKPETSSYDFVLAGREVPETFRFIQFTDAECWSAGRWFEDLKALAAAEKPAFAVNTGDLCYRKGLQFQIARVNAETLGIPVYYTLGNHDLLKPEAGEYGGETFYESLYGPAWRAFEYGDVLFLALPVAAGDAKPSFSRQDLADWLKNLFAVYPPDKPVIILTHHPLLFGSDWKVGDFELAKYNLKGIFYGHFHVHDFRRYGKVPGFATSAVRVGGASSAPAAFRLTEVDRKGNCRSELRWTYAGENLSIATPAGNDQLAVDRAAAALPVLATVSGPASPVRVNATLTGPDGGENSLELQRRTDWSFAGAFPLPQQTGKYQLKLDAVFKDGHQVKRSSEFNWPPSELSIAPGGDAPQFLGDAKRSGFSAAVGNRAQLAWATALDGHIFVSSPVVAGKRIFIGTVDDAMGEKGGVHALDAETGRLLWSYRTEGSVRHSLAVAKGLVFATDSRNHVYALDAATGRLRWEAPGIGDELSGNSTGVLAADGRVFAGRDRGLRAFDAETGRELWRISRDEIPQYRPDAGTVNAFALAGDTLIAPANWIQLRAFDAATGKLRWVNSDHRYLQNAGSIGPDGKLYCAAGRLLVIDPADGKVLKMSEKTGNISFNTGSTPQLRGPSILIGSAEKGMVALDRDTLAVRWSTPYVGDGLTASAPYRLNSPAVTASAATAADTVWFGALDGNFYGANLADGALRRKFALGAPVFSSATISGNMLYTADFAGRVYGFVLE